MKATREDITRLFSGIDAHTVVEILKQRPSVSDLEAAVLVLQGDDEQMHAAAEPRRATVNRLMGLLEEAGLVVPSNTRDILRP